MPQNKVKNHASCQLPGALSKSEATPNLGWTGFSRCFGSTSWARTCLRLKYPFSSTIALLSLEVGFALPDWQWSLGAEMGPSWGWLGRLTRDSKSTTVSTSQVTSAKISQNDWVCKGECKFWPWRSALGVLPGGPAVAVSHVASFPASLAAPFEMTHRMQILAFALPVPHLESSRVLPLYLYLLR